MLSDRIHLSEDGCLAIAITVDEETGDLACSPAVNSIGCFDDDENSDVLYELISDKVDDLLKQASNKAGSVEAFLQKRNFREQIKNFIVPRIAGTFAPVNVPAEVEEYDPYLC